MSLCEKSVSSQALGNITSKSDVGAGTWTYDTVKKHAVKTAGTNTFSYDANGNQTLRNGSTVTWTSFNYPSRVNNGTKYHDYFYGGDRQRYKQVYYNGSSSETTIFVGGILEKHTVGSVTKYRHYINAGNSPVALYVRPSSGSITTQYFLLDHQGSVAEITNAAGGVDASENFAAFGQRRDATDWSGPPANETTLNAITQRGYTFHTNSEASSLIHMNGRIADSLTGRFLSPDPYVTNPGGTQFFNRYSYVNNNPMTFTDPSGFYCETTCAAIIVGVVNTFRNFISGGSRPRPLPKGCWESAVGCNGAASSTKLSIVTGDIVTTPTTRTADTASSQTGDVSGGWSTASFSFGIEAIAGGNPFPVGGPFGGGGPSVGFNSAGQIYYKFTAKAGAGNWAYAGVSPVTSFGVSSNHLPNGISTEGLLFADAYFGAGETIGYGATYSSDGLSFSRSIRFPGKGYGGAIVAGGQIDTYVASPPLIPYYVQGANSVGVAITEYSMQGSRHVVNTVNSVLSWFGISD